jgi:hypothetical protein
MKTRCQTALLSYLLVVGCAGAAFAQTADDVVERHLAALGGREALAKITSRKSTGTVTLSTSAAELAGVVEVYSKPPNKTHVIIRLDLTPVAGTGEMIVQQIFDGKTGYGLNSLQGDSEITGRQLANMRNNLFPSPLLAYKDAGLRLELLPHEMVNGRDAFVLRSSPAAGSPSRLFFDAETYLLVRVVTTIDGPQGGELEQTNDFSDFRVVDGVKVPFRVVNATALQTLTATLTTVQHNIAIDDAMFVKK